MEELMKQERHEVANPYTDVEAFKGIYDIGKMFASSQLIPQNFQGKAMDCTIAVDIANRFGASPMFVMQNLYVVKGKPVWSGQACMALIRGSKEFEHIRTVYAGERGEDSWGCYVQAKYRGTDEVVKGPLVTIKMAKDEGWYAKPGSKWQTMPELMLAYRAAAFFSRVYIPNALMGYCVEGEPEDISEKQEKRETINPFPPEEIMEEAEGIFE